MCVCVHKHTNLCPGWDPWAGLVWAQAAKQKGPWPQNRLLVGLGVKSPNPHVSWPHEEKLASQHHLLLHALV